MQKSRDNLLKPVKLINQNVTLIITYYPILLYHGKLTSLYHTDNRFYYICSQCRTLEEEYFLIKKGVNSLQKSQFKFYLLPISSAYNQQLGHMILGLS